MGTNLKDILTQYVEQEPDGKYYCKIDSKKEFGIPVSIAQACPAYLEDVEDELYCEDKFSCYNCRYRRWEKHGFSCYKGFPAG